MGKERKYKISADPKIVGHDRVGTIPRDELKEIVSNAFRYVTNTALYQELLQMCETVPYIAYGVWASYIEEDDGSLSRCGCPLGTISDWLTSEEYNDHEGKDPSEITGAYARFDDLMRFRYPNKRRLRVV